MISAPKTLTYSLSIGKVDSSSMELLEEIEKVKIEVAKIKPKAAKVIESINGILNLTEDLYQRARVEEDIVAVLPTINNFIEISLFISSTKEISLSIEGKNIKGSYDKTIKPGFIYEFILAYTEEEWLVGNLSF